MSNIIGTPFDSYVKNQINIRQQALGAHLNIYNSTLRYYTTKTPWLRLASSVDIKNLKKNGELDTTTVYQKLLKVGFTKDQIIDENLARNLILQGGVVSVNQGETTTANPAGIEFNGQKFGLISNKEGDSLFNGAYGFGGVSERGFVPMPGITSATTQYYNNGALSKATINIKCFSRSQFALLDVLYLRPGYTLLLEFGWSVYYPNNGFGEVSTFPNFNTTPLEFLLNPSSFTKYTDGQYSMQNLIVEEREKYSGNYEGVFGKITNFKWSFNTDGSYDCTVDLVGVGSVLESLRLNTISPYKAGSKAKTDAKSDKEYPGYDEWLGTYLRNKPKVLKRLRADYPSLLGWPNEIINTMRNFNILKGMVQSPTGNKTKDAAVYKAIKDKFRAQYDKKIERLKNADKIEEKNDSNNPLIANKDTTILNKYFFNAYNKLLLAPNNDTDIKFSGVFLSMENAGCSISDTYNGEIAIPGQGPSSVSGFIKFAYLLQIIEENCNLFSSINNGTPLMKFDFSYTNMEEDDNYMAIVPPNLSTNPQKCIVPYTKAAIEGVIDPVFFTYPEGDSDLPTDTDINKSLTENTGFLVEGNPYVGRIGNVMINLRFAAQALSEAPKDEDGGVSVISYLKTILGGVNESLGSINNFMVVHDESTGYIKIYDETPMPSIIQTSEEEYSTLNIFGVKSFPNDEVLVASQDNFGGRGEGSFVTNIGLDAEIPSNFSSIISIGSQLDGSNLQGNAYSFSSYNNGLQDRIIPNKASSKKLAKEKEINPVTEALNIFKEKLKYYGGGDKISPFGAVYTKVDDSSYNFDPSVTTDFTENYTGYIKLIQGLAAIKNQIPKPFFLPFNLNIEMEGMSGIRLFEKFRVTDDILPPSYDKDSVDIIVKGINHNIDLQSWTTTLDTLSVPRFDVDLIPPSTGSQSSSDKSKQLEQAVNDPVIANDNPDIITRLRLTRLADNGIQTLGILEVLDENGGLLYALPTCELPYKDNRSRQSCIPVGTYDVASRYSDDKHKQTFIIVNNGTNKTGTIKEPYPNGLEITGNNKAPRTYILIHAAPSALPNNAKAWLQGCMAPGFIFNTKAGDDNSSIQKSKIVDSDGNLLETIDLAGKGNGNPRGTGTQYGGTKSPSYNQSKQANQKLVRTLQAVGEDPGFQIEIRALGGGNAPGPKFYTNEVDTYIRSIETITGETYTQEKGGGVGPKRQ